MQVDNEVFDYLMALARRAQTVSTSQPADTIIKAYQESWADELMSILNRCVVLDDVGNVTRHPVENKPK